jgi:hypothetical protein
VVAQSPPYAEQNAQHDARLFRLASFSPWREQSGIVGPTDLAVSAQSTPNMSVQVAAGRAWLKGTQVASVSGGSWSTQGAYFAYNDAPVTLTVAAADPTNPRIDAVVAYVTDSFYNGSTNTFVLGIVTGTPAASPATPAVPSNGLLLGTLAVAANATSIAAGNVSAGAGLMLTARGGVQPVLSTDATAGAFVGQYRDHPTNGLERWNGTGWGIPTATGGWVSFVNSGYSWTVPITGTPTEAPAIQGGSGAEFTVTVPTGRQLEVELSVPRLVVASGTNSQLRLIEAASGTVVDEIEYSTAVGTGFAYPLKMTGHITGAGTALRVLLQGWGSSGTTTLSAGTTGGGLVRLRYRII